MNYKRGIKAAKKQAKKSKLCNWRIGAVIVKGNKVIGKGYNKFSGDSEYIAQKYGVKNLWSLHAEMAAILDVQGNMDGAVMFIAGVKHNGNRVYCRPCKDCMKILKHTNLEAVCYETKDGIEMLVFD